MTAGRWAQVKEVLDAALDRPREERSAFLAEACAGQPDLQAEVHSLLAAHEGAQGFLATEPTLAPTGREIRSAPQAGDRIGAYRVVREIGRGGMGVVYLAERADDEYRKQVAIKLVRADADGPSVASRFRRERQILADLEHPNIARLLDAGTTDEGRPYFVMEHVLGLPIDAYCDARKLSVERRLELFRTVCDAVAHAHERGVLHRDIKPGNILVTAEQVPKLLDFGIAKVLGPEPSGEHTTTGNQPMTPAYASPDQVRGVALTPASDVYSLGVLLYRLLTGGPPYGGESVSLLGLARAICEEEPRPPSVVAAPHERRRLAGDLDAIALRALRKEPEHRYASAGDLSEDVRRHLQGRPVAARRAGWGYRAGRFFRRNRSSVYAAAVVALSTAVLSGLVSRWTNGSGSGASRGAGADAGAPLGVVPLTTYRGEQDYPSLSPDARSVAFSWNGPAEDNFDIYKKPTAEGPPVRLTSDPAVETAPAWSPDGRSIAFLRALSKDRFSLHVVPAAGGPERRLGEVSIPDRTWVAPPFLSWFPDSRSLAVTDRLATGPAAVFQASVATGQRKQLTFPPSGIQGDTAVAVSPDGRTLAFGRFGQLGEWSWSINVAPLESGSGRAADVRPLTSEHRDREAGLVLSGLAWTADSRRLVYAAGPSFWTLEVGGPSPGTPRRLDVGTHPSHPTISHATNRLAFAHHFGSDHDIWRARLPRSGPPEAPVRLIASTRLDFAQRYSPDGRKIAFESDRGGNLEIWVCESDGEGCRQLTRVGSAFTGTPAWSPDGTEVAFYSRVEGSARIFAVGLRGGPHRLVAEGGTSNMFPNWSRDGRSIYFGSNRTGRNEIWKVPAGGGAAVQVTRGGGFASAESFDGKWLYFTRSEAADAGLVRKRLPDGEETQVLPSVLLHNFDLASDGVYFVADDGSGPALRFHRFGDGGTGTLTPLPVGYVGLSVSRDREWVLYTAVNPAASNLSLVEGFR